LFSVDEAGWKSSFSALEALANLMPNPLPFSRFLKGQLDEDDIHLIATVEKVPEEEIEAHDEVRARRPENRTFYHFPPCNIYLTGYLTRPLRTP
jgi:hypothetical protein